MDMMKEIYIEKEVYVSPECEVVTVNLEGTIAVVSDYDGFNPSEQNW